MMTLATSFSYPTDPIELTRELVAIPSYVQQDVHEGLIAEYLEEWLIRQAPWMTLERQLFGAGRANLIARSTSAQPTLVLAGHFDTVLPHATNHPTEVPGAIAGLGAVDMKGGLAAMLAAIVTTGERSGLWLLAYGDEEYYFTGMKAFISAYGTIRPKLTIIGEPTDLKIWNAVRGIIEIEVVVEGKSGHASRPKEGLNAIQVALAGYRAVEKLVAKTRDASLGRSSINLAGLHGGFIASGDKSDLATADIVWQANKIPDVARLVFEIRTTSSELNAEAAKDVFTRAVTATGGEVALASSPIDFGTLWTEPKAISDFSEIVRAVVGQPEYWRAEDKGYTDGQLLAETIESPVICFGPGPMRTAHRPGEYVTFTSLQQATMIFAQTLDKYLGRD